MKEWHSSIIWGYSFVCECMNCYLEIKIWHDLEERDNNRSWGRKEDIYQQSSTTTYRYCCCRYPQARPAVYESCEIQSVQPQEVGISGSRGVYIYVCVCMCRGVSKRKCMVKSSYGLRFSPAVVGFQNWQQQHKHQAPPETQCCLEEHLRYSSAVYCGWEGGSEVV